ncbi:MAG: A24 family peptidase [Actinobacteria bacterium]|nr:A24 family peptidase [Actinomycetota bacterium]
MIFVLTIFVGAVVGALVGIIAKKFIVEIDSQKSISRVKLIILGVALGTFFAFLIRTRFSSWDLQLAYAILCSGLILQTMIDALTHRLVRSVTYLLGVTGVVLLLISAIRTDSFNSIVAALVCAFASGLLFSVINKIAPGGLGVGDVRLVPVLGWYLGFLGYNEAIWAIFIACLSASVVGVSLIAVGRGSLNRRLAFGPYLTLGTLVCVFVGKVLPSVFS